MLHSPFRNSFNDLLYRGSLPHGFQPLVVTRVPAQNIRRPGLFEHAIGDVSPRHKAQVCIGAVIADQPARGRIRENPVQDRDDSLRLGRVAGYCGGQLLGVKAQKPRPLPKVWSLACFHVRRGSTGKRTMRGTVSEGRQTYQTLGRTTTDPFRISLARRHRRCSPPYRTLGSDTGQWHHSPRA